MLTHMLIVRGVSSVTVEKVTYKPGEYPVNVKAAKAARRFRYGVHTRRLAEPIPEASDGPAPEPVVKTKRELDKADAKAPKAPKAPKAVEPTIDEVLKEEESAKSEDEDEDADET